MVRSKILVKLLNLILKIKYEEEFSIELRERSSVSIFEIEKLAQDFPYPTFEHVLDNNIYGIGYWLKKYASVNKPLDIYIEHGVFFGEHLQVEQKDWFVKTIVTLSKNRKQTLQNLRVKKNIIPIGPYIHYSEPYLTSSEFVKLKKKIGKTLLVFPTHSSNNLNTNNFSSELVNRINLLKHNFDSVIINLYYLDALKTEIVKAYKQEGYFVTCAGHKFDPFFLSRLKTIIQLADYTVSNSGHVGTQIGYCIYLGKPHYICNVNLVTTPKDSVGVKRLKENYILREFENREVYNVFENFKENITQEQKKIVEKYWGLSEIKSKNEIFNIIQNIYISDGVQENTD